MTTIWQRYFFSCMVKTTLFCLFGFFLLYAIIDYSTQASSLKHGTSDSHLLYLLDHYLQQFSGRLPILLPFSLAIATIYNLTTFNQRNEWVALLTSGIKLKTLLRPFLLVGVLATALLYLNAEYIQPYALKRLSTTKEERHRIKRQRMNEPAVHHVTLEDGGRLLFSRFDEKEQIFTDLFFIGSPDHLYRMASLDLKGTATGFFVDEFVRNGKGQLLVVNSFETLSFPSLKIDSANLNEALLAPEELSLTNLYSRLPSSITSERSASISANFAYKLLMPWLCLLAVIGPAPFCVRFSRSLPIFLIYAVTLFSLVAIQLGMDAALILTERQGAPPFETLFAVFALAAFPWLINYWRMR